ncbi:MAG: LPS export ABC transporter periplasmic protein LptC, partial [Candidatus Omnitrophica bacterium]|nr:LPS export ABC transporter periplasmic protein LptC [Candidatus Omnitrophota bacterium]
MKFVRIIIILALFLSYSFVLRAQQEQTADQQFSDFNLVSYGEKGKKLWEIDGKSADILSDIVKLTQVVANVYGAEEDINIKADKGDFDKTNNKMHLEKNVVITTSKGGKLTTDSLDWDRKEELISTKAPVALERDNMVVIGQGA